MQDRFEEGEVAALAKKAGLEITPIDEHFSDLSKLGHSSLRHYAIYLLERLLATADEAPHGNQSGLPTSAPQTTGQ